MTPEKVIRRTKLITRTAALCLTAALAIVTTPDVLAESGITNVIDGVTTNFFVAKYYVGANGSFNTLIITNAGVMSVETNGQFGPMGGTFIGSSAIANSNTVIVAGSGSLLTNGIIYVGYTGSFNNLIITSGGTVMGSVVAGSYSGSGNNSIVVTGSGSLITNAQDIIIGQSSSGNSLIISDGGRVYANNGQGSGCDYISNSVLVTGAGSILSLQNDFYADGISIGNNGTTLTITDGGQVFDRAGRCGYGMLDTFTVSGAGSVWSNSSSFYFGLGSWGGRNRLTVTNAQLFNTVAYIAGIENLALITGSGAVWRNSGSLTIGASSTGDIGVRNNLTISNSGQVFNTSGSIIGTSNSVVVSGVGSVWSNSSSLTIGNSGSGNSLTIISNATVTASSLTLRSGGVLNLYGGLLQSGGSSVSNGVTFAVGDGVQSATLDLLGGTHTFANGLKLNTNSSLIGNGGIFGNVTNFSIIAPGHSVGALSITGDLALMNTSELDFEIAGTGTNDHLDISGLLAAGGGLKLTLTDGYTGNAGDTFDLFNFGSLTGTFSQTNLPSLAGGLQWNTSQLYTLGDISIMGVPEPGTCSLLALGLAAFASRRVRNEKLRVKNSGNS